MSNSGSRGFGGGCLFLLAIFGLLGWIAYIEADNMGWRTHDSAVDVYMKGDWLVGENRVCSGVQALQPDDTYIMDALFCPAEAEASQGHNINVKFWGKTSRPDAVKANRLLTWQCTRNSDGFTCKALD